MTKKDYEIIARAISNYPDHALSVLGFATHMAHELAMHNPRFNTKIFIRACMPSWVIGTKAEAKWEKAIENA